MKLINEKGKLFGIINVVDLIIVIIELVIPHEIACPAASGLLQELANILLWPSQVFVCIQHEGVVSTILL